MRADPQPTPAADTHAHDASVQSGNHITSTDLEALWTPVLICAANNIAVVEPADEMQSHCATSYGFRAGADDHVFNFQT